MTNSKKKRPAIFGLIVVFEELSFNGGFLSFEEAYELYLAHQNTNTDRDLFRDKLLDSEIGLCIVYFIHPVTKTSYIAFKSKYIKTEYFLSNFIKSTEMDDEKLPTFLSDKKLLKLALSLMDTEFDKQLLKLAVISAQPSLNAIMNMGIDKSTAVNLANKVGVVLEEYQNCLIAACGMVKLRLRQKIESDFNAKNKLIENLEENSELLQDSRKQQLKRKIDLLDKRIDFNQSLLQQNTKKHSPCLKTKSKEQQIVSLKDKESKDVNLAKEHIEKLMILRRNF